MYSLIISDWWVQANEAINLTFPWPLPSSQGRVLIALIGKAPLMAYRGSVEQSVTDVRGHIISYVDTCCNVPRARWKADVSNSK